MSKSYVIKEKVGEREAYRIGSSRVSLDSVVYSWQQGDSPETIVENFPVLTLEEVYGAIAFYLANQESIDAYLRLGEEQTVVDRERWRSRDDLHRKLWHLRQERRRQVV
jgi:uncharacterized protein (DUF433 family)